MNLKSEKGFTGIDISIAIIVLFIFVSIIAVLVYNFNASSNDVERRTQATYYAIEEIENIKKQDFVEFMGISEANGNSVIKDKEPIEGSDGYHKTITVVDYADLEPDKIEDLVKKIIVKISYMSKGQEQNVELSIVRSKGS